MEITREEVRKRISYLLKNPAIKIRIKEDSSFIEDIKQEVYLSILEKKSAKELAHEIKRKYDLNIRKFNRFKNVDRKQNKDTLEIVSYFKRYNSYDEYIPKSSTTRKAVTLYVPEQFKKIKARQEVIQYIIENNIKVPIPRDSKLVSFSVKLKLPYYFKLLSLAKKENKSISKVFREKFINKIK